MMISFNTHVHMHAPVSAFLAHSFSSRTCALFSSRTRVSVHACICFFSSRSLVHSFQSLFLSLHSPPASGLSLIFFLSPCSLSFSFSSPCSLALLFCLSRTSPPSVLSFFARSLFFLSLSSLFLGALFPYLLYSVFASVFSSLSLSLSVSFKSSLSLF